MREQQIHGIIGRIRDDLVLEAEPRRLAALYREAEAPASSEATGGGVILSDPIGEPKKNKRRFKKWLPMVVAAAVALTVGLNVWLISGMNDLIGQGGLTPPSGTPSGNPFGDLFGSLFPFLSPETETSHEVTVRDPEEFTEPEDSCADGHDYEETVEREATCYSVARYRFVCRNCGREKFKIGTELLDHTCENGYCTVCGMIEGAHPLLNCSVSLGTDGYVLEGLTGEIGDTLILPNVAYTKENGILPVTALGEGILRNQSELSVVVLPEGIVSIGSDAFNGCTALKEVRISEGLVSVGDNAFMDCTSLREIRLPDSVTHLGIRAFDGCTSLEQFSFPDTWFEGYMGDYMFSRCTSLTAVRLPANISGLPTGIFSECTALSFIDLPDGLCNIGFAAFSGSGLVEIDIPSNVHTLTTGIFSGCASLRSVVLPAYLTTIENLAFSGCTALEEIVWNDRLEDIEYGAFRNCTSLKEVTLPASLVRVDSEVFIGCSALERVTFHPDSSVVLSDRIFYRCTSLRDISLPDGLLEIGGDTFYGCTSLEAMVLPASLITMHKKAFDGCTALTSLTYKGTVEEWKAIFKGTLTIPVHCSDGTVVS